MDLVELVRETVLRFHEQSEKAGSRVTIEVEGTTVGHWDRCRIDQVISNLLSNAIKYGGGGADCREDLRW